jgi:bifunctional aspartokinase / homoserine dehydrogenase 1
MSNQTAAMAARWPHLLVMKFGGTSMGSAERIREAARLAAAQKRPTVVVVSAMSKVTDLLLDGLRHAEARDQAGLDGRIAELRSRHQECANQLLRGEALLGARAAIGVLVDEYARLAGGILMLGERPLRSVDEAIAIGERLSAGLLAAFLDDEGFAATAVNARNVVVTNALFGNATPLTRPTREKAQAVLGPLLDAGRLPIVTGFNGATDDGRPTTLGRGGSDFSASTIAAALDAEELWIWSDVDGILTADPRLVPNAAVMEEITYAEAAELAYNGAKVLHARTLAPLVSRQIPVWSKNSFAPDKPGTKIVARATRPSEGRPRAVTSTPVTLISVEPLSPELAGVKLMARAMEALAAAGVEVLALTSSSYQQKFCFAVRRDEALRVQQALEAELALEMAHHYVAPLAVNAEVGLLAIVGEGMRGLPGFAGKIFTAISREGINIIAIAQGSSELTITIIVPAGGLERAVRAVHAECGLGG